jgi:hypothetical protein
MKAIYKENGGKGERHYYTKSDILDQQESNSEEGYSDHDGGLLINVETTNRMNKMLHINTEIPKPAVLNLAPQVPTEEVKEETPTAGAKRVKEPEIDSTP